MNITIEQKNGKTVVTCADEGFEHPVETPSGLCDARYTVFPPRSVCVNTVTPYNNWVNELVEVAEDIVSTFHYEGREERQFQMDMTIDKFQAKLWGQIKRLAAVLKEGDER